MPVNRYFIKSQAREKLRSAQPRPILEGLLFILLAGILTAISTALLLSHVNRDAVTTYFQYTSSLMTAEESTLDLNASYLALSDYLNENLMEPIPAIDTVITFVLDLLRGIVAVGFCLFCLNTVRDKDASLWNLLDGFARFLPLLLLLTIRDLLVRFGLSLLIIPGLMLAYRYRLAVFLMLDNPALNPLQCLALSGRIMRGKKWSLFLLDLSFLGWALLALLPLFVCALAVLSSVVFGDPLELLPLILGSLAGAAALSWLLPYYELSCVGFYEAVKTPIESIPPSPPSV